MRPTSAAGGVRYTSPFAIRHPVPQPVIRGTFHARGRPTSAGVALRGAASASLPRLTGGEAEQQPPRVGLAQQFAFWSIE